jgi:hypothetical protein
MRIKSHLCFLDYRVSALTPNGPAIKVVSVAERMKAGAEKLSWGRVQVPAVMSEAWRGFCHQVASFLSSTCFAVQGLLGAGHLSPYAGLIESSGGPVPFERSEQRDHGDVPLYCDFLRAGTVCKNRDKLITFIVRVMGCIFLFRKGNLNYCVQFFKKKVKLSFFPILYSKV